MDIIYCLFSNVSFSSWFLNLTPSVNVYAEVAATIHCHWSVKCVVFSIIYTLLYTYRVCLELDVGWLPTMENPGYATVS